MRGDEIFGNTTSSSYVSNADMDCHEIIRL